MSGEAAPFRAAGPCPVTRGPHCADPESYLVADAAVRDRSAAVRLAVWRCQYCGTLLAGIGRPRGVLDGSPGSRAEVDAQEFTWLEEAVTLLNAPEVTDGHHDRADDPEHVGEPV